MAEQEPTTTGNGNGNGADPAQGEAQVSIIAQYLKDLSVENPSSPQVFQWQNQPALDVQFNINADKVADDIHEVALKIEVSARSDNGVHFIVDLAYAGLFGLRGIPEEALPPFLLIEAPRLLFPFARQIIAEAIVNAGFPPFYLDPIDFTSVYMAQVQALENQDAGEEGAGEKASDEPAPGNA